MTTYAIGDVQGCFNQLQQLLKQIQFNPANDDLWFVGDIVNRGPDSLKTLRFIHGLGDRAITVLGNHDLHLLAIAHGVGKCRRKDTLNAILTADDRDELLNWLIQRPLLHFDNLYNVCMVHAGLHPAWDIAAAKTYAREVEKILQSNQRTEFFQQMYGDLPSKWSTQLQGWDRIRLITNVFTRMRYLNKTTQELSLSEKNAPGNQANHLVPWFDFNHRNAQSTPIVFGHWSTLPNPQLLNIHPLDTGCLWGGKLTALVIETPLRKQIQVDCPPTQPIEAY